MLLAVNNWFWSSEVIDGQQRLTTIYLIGHYINEMHRGKDKDPEIELEYKTRIDSPDFLKKLSVNPDSSVSINKNNIDFSYISLAYSTIHKWFQNKKSNNKFKKDDFIKKFFNDTKVIWYESSEADTVSIFTRINIGKIPLTNAELVKARFLNSSNFTSSDKSINIREIELKQIEIATEWDRIENKLQSPEFWYFVNESENNFQTRIEFILDLISEKKDSDDEFYTFNYFNNQFKQYSEKEINENWNLIKTYFQTLEEWYNDRELFHKIGFLISCSEKIDELYLLSQVNSKTEFKVILDKRLANKVSKNIEDLSYNDAYATRKVLLLFNILTMLNNVLEASRFPFDRYKTEKWDIEHIHSVQEGMPKNEKHQIDWLNSAIPFIKKDLLIKVQTFILAPNNNFEALYNDVLDYFNEAGKHEEINDISNLCLLDYKTNRGYGNNVFPAKRAVIIEKDTNGTFIPICTKNVFLKFYSPNVEQLTFWGETERTDYITEITRVLTPIINLK